MFRHIGVIVDEPLHAALEARQAIDNFRLQRFHGEERDEAYHGANLKVVLASIRQSENVIVEAILVVPQGHAINADIVHGVRDVDEVLEELAGDIFVSNIFLGEFQGNGQHIQAVHAHPTGAVGLFEMSTSGERGGAIEDSDIVESQEAALENVGAVGILAIHPPSEIQKELVKNFFEEGAVGDATDAALDFVNAPGGPGVHGRIHVAESPLVSRQLPVGMHIPFAKQEDELLFGEIGIHQREGHTVEGQIPGSVPGVFPFVGHGNDVVVVEVRPILIAAFPAVVRRLRPGGIAFEPGVHVIMVKLLGPKHAGERLAHNGFGVGGKTFRDA